jgi:predicted component of type VI protein secretion system
MDKQQLHQSLEQLHADLQQAQSVDDKERELLESLARDIRELLNRSEASTQHYRSLGERLSAALLRFELSHPALTASIAQAIDGLNRIGI